jgi:hypothetical protein
MAEERNCKMVATLTPFAICVIVCMCGFCNVCVFEGFVMCGCFGNMYTVLWLWFFLTWLRVFLSLNEVFPCFFLSCKVNARVKLVKRGHGPHSSTLVVICVVLLLFVLFGCYVCCSVYCLCVNVYCHRVTTQMQLKNVSCHTCSNHGNNGLSSRSVVRQIRYWT